MHPRTHVGERNGRPSPRTARRAAPHPDGDRGGGPAQFLKLLGARVRDARARHGMTRRMLAHDSGVSERYLAQLEAGCGNFSITLLRRVAAAIDVPLAELVGEEVPPVEYALLAERLRRLSPAELAEAAALLARRFGERPARLERIALIGLRGAGKSTLGAALAKRLGWRFVELSREIERAAGMSVGEIFDLLGQAAYRRYERRAVESLLRAHAQVVIAAGGGLVSELSTFERLLESCYTVWLQASPREYWERVRRQGDYRMSAGVSATQAMADMRRILAQREPLYAKADARLDTAGRTPAQSLRDLLATIRRARIAAAQLPRRFHMHNDA
ncbi:MAG TPA: helix-turn-helix transcriptional regulator [Candidatus Binataceae bacterium]|nr:helix-turn-helix transcriptional regulator [Candidatus Binataceae bacterium]